ncbi:hypothetical protein D3C85_1414750 [compost metagenome]
MLNDLYGEMLKKMLLRPEVYELFGLVLEDENILTARRAYMDERKVILGKISKQEFRISKARNYLLDEKIDSDDFNKLKKEHDEILNGLNCQLNTVDTNLIGCEKNDNIWHYNGLSVFQSYKYQDTKGKRDIISLFTPTINPNTRTIESLKISKALSLIVEHCQ